MKVKNVTAYKPTSWSKMARIEVVVMLDSVPGAWHDPSDFLDWLVTHSYVQSAEIKETFRNEESDE